MWDGNCSTGILNLRTPYFEQISSYNFLKCGKNGRQKSGRKKKAEEKIADGKNANEKIGKNNNITSNFSMTANINVKKILKAFWIYYLKLFYRNHFTRQTNAL